MSSPQPQILGTATQNRQLALEQLSRSVSQAIDAFNATATRDLGLKRLDFDKYKFAAENLLKGFGDVLLNQYNGDWRLLTQWQPQMALGALDIMTKGDRARSLQLLEEFKKLPPMNADQLDRAFKAEFYSGNYVIERETQQAAQATTPQREPPAETPPPATVEAPSQPTAPTLYQEFAKRYALPEGAESWRNPHIQGPPETLLELTPYEDARRNPQIQGPPQTPVPYKGPVPYKEPVPYEGPVPYKGPVPYEGARASVADVLQMYKNVIPSAFVNAVSSVPDSKAGIVASLANTFDRLRSVPIEKRLSVLSTMTGLWKALGLDWDSFYKAVVKPTAPPREEANQFRWLFSRTKPARDDEYRFNLDDLGGVSEQEPIRLAALGSDIPLGIYLTPEERKRIQATTTVVPAVWSQNAPPRQPESQTRGNATTGPTPTAASQSAAPPVRSQNAPPQQPAPAPPRQPAPNESQSRGNATTGGAPDESRTRDPTQELIDTVKGVLPTQDEQDIIGWVESMMGITKPTNARDRYAAGKVDNEIQRMVVRVNRSLTPNQVDAMRSRLNMDPYQLADTLTEAANTPLDEMNPLFRDLYVPQSREEKARATQEWWALRKKLGLAEEEQDFNWRQLALATMKSIVDAMAALQEKPEAAPDVLKMFEVLAKMEDSMTQGLKPDERARFLVNARIPKDEKGGDNKLYNPTYAKLWENLVDAIAKLAGTPVEYTKVAMSRFGLLGRLFGLTQEGSYPTTNIVTPQREAYQQFSDAANKFIRSREGTR